MKHKQGLLKPGILPSTPNKKKVCRINRTTLLLCNLHSKQKSIFFSFKIRYLKFCEESH